MKYKLKNIREKVLKYRQENNRVPLGVKEGNYIYIFINTKNQKRYIGKSIDIIARLDSYFQHDSTNNEYLLFDINNNIEDFDIEILKINDTYDLKMIESDYISKYKKLYELYNVAENRERKKSKRIDVVLGGVRFTSKKKLKEYNRNLLESYNDEEYVTNEHHYQFAYDLMKYHPNYKIEWGSKLKVQLDNKYTIDSGWGRSKGYNNFRFEINGEFIQLSSNKCIENI
jgi:hypothetical protein